MAQLTISPTKAMLICINTMIGAGLFINPKPLTVLAGPLGFVGYILAAIIFLPLIVCIAELTALHPVAGGLYVFSKTYVGDWAGFLSGWTYFVGKTTSASMLLHTFVNYFYHRIVWLQQVPIIVLDCCLLGLIFFLNSAGVGVGGRVQYLFTALKALPILSTFFIGCFYFDITNFADISSAQSVFSTLPIAVFSLMGFEIICSIGNMIQDAQLHIRRVILTAFCIVAAANTLFQLVTFGALGLGLEYVHEPVLIIALKALSNYPVVASIINGAVFASIIGSSFSVLTSNCWNLHTIARHNHLPAASYLTRLNVSNVPWVSLLIELVLGCFILIITIQQRPLQNMAVFATVLTYLMSSFAALFAVKEGKIKGVGLWVPVLAIIGCAAIVSICLRRMFLFGVSTSFLGILAFGCVLALAKRAMSSVHE